MMSISELIEAVNQSDMTTKAKAEVTDILKLYVDIAKFISEEDYGR